MLDLDRLELGEVTLFQNDCFLDLLVDFVAFVLTLELFLELLVIPLDLVELLAVVLLEVVVLALLPAELLVLLTVFDLVEVEELDPLGL